MNLFGGDEDEEEEEHLNFGKKPLAKLPMPIPSGPPKLPEPPKKKANLFNDSVIEDEEETLPRVKNAPPVLPPPPVTQPPPMMAPPVLPPPQVQPPVMMPPQMPQKQQSAFSAEDEDDGGFTTYKKKPQRNTGAQMPLPGLAQPKPNNLMEESFTSQNEDNMRSSEAPSKMRQSEMIGSGGNTSSVRDMAKNMNINLMGLNPQQRLAEKQRREEEEIRRRREQEEEEFARMDREREEKALRQSDV